MGVDTLGLRELKRLLALIGEQYGTLLSRRKSIALVGPVNTGKSSLYNALIAPSAIKARVSPVPGTTRTPLSGDAEAFWVVDTPGINESSVGGEDAGSSAERHRAAMGVAQQADVLVIVFDATRGIANDEAVIYHELRALGKPFVVALNKIDLVTSDLPAVLQAVARSLQLPVDEIIPVSALKGTNLDRLLLALLKTDPQLLSTLAEVLPGSRWLLATRTVLAASAAAGTANLVTAALPIPFASFAVITPIQAGMVLNLGRIYGRKLTLGRAKELALAFGSAILARELFYSLVDIVPVVGWALGTAIAAGTTMALGYAAAVWFASGEQPSRAAIRQLAEEMTGMLVNGLRHLPDRGSARKDINILVSDTWKRAGESAAGKPDGHVGGGEPKKG